MANHLPLEKQCMVVSALAEGSSIRAIERMTGVHRDTVMRLGVKIGKACERLMHETMRDLPCEKIEMDEIWGYVGKKEKHVEAGDNPEEVGDIWTFVAIDPETKAVPAYKVGKRNQEYTDAFVSDVASRMKQRIHLSSDAMQHYATAVDEAWGRDVDYGQVIKMFSSSRSSEQAKYSPNTPTVIQRAVIRGGMKKSSICTSRVESQNLTMRMHCRRLTRLTNAFSKKLENFKAAIGLHYGYYNFVKIHSSIRCTPAMALGVSSRLWTVEDLVGLGE